MFGFPFLKSFRGFRIKRFRSEIEFQDVFLDKFVAERGTAFREYAEQWLEVPLSRWLLWGLYVCFIAVTLAFFARSFYLQAFAGDELERKAQENAIRSVPIASDRGVIYDNFGAQLVFNKSSFDFVCDKRDLPADRTEKERILRRASDILNIPFADLKAEFDKTSNPKFLLVQNLSHEHLVVLETRAEELEGCEIQKNTIREYAAGPTLSHILGYTAKISPEELRERSDYFVTDQIGKTGIERAYETELRGVPGKILTEKDALGRVVKEGGEIASFPGKSLVLWLDFGLQQKLKEALEDTLSRIGAKKAVAVALDPATGGVLSLVSIPGFDNNLFSRGITHEQYEEIVSDPLNPLFNRAIAGNYPAGSTIKPLVASAALEEHIIDPDKKILTRGYIEVPHAYDPDIVYRFPDWKDHGWVDMRDAIAVSSNVYFYTIGGGFEDQKGLGPTRLKEYLTKFGWGSKTGIDLPGEGKGLVPDPEWKRRVKGEGWWDGDTYLFSIGQGNVLATPLQVAASFVPLANGGKLYKPQMVKEIVETGTAFPPVVIREGIIDKENIEVVREGMRQAVKWGSAVLLNQLSVSSGAKTGTAQTGRKDAQGLDYLYSWVTVFAPYENPKIVLTVMVEDAKEGSLAVLPVAKEALEWYFTK
ncbi:MAG TPA: penicillin-binding protein 2 [Candidatus Wildermuthbacteria bacterium]|uniref:Cell elongation specific D,D-transpeptidase, penicillin-binding protein 2 n=1 Tax=Candidatus Yanofskybacteria bacterium GW2011_GWC1_48_11 TaxID=1619027 RepID=A0A837ILB5_9BACT|nr:MAG: cell elongation specific D,D-transpeptidase, penicillin-binding protein 2 [Candidatus Yanofskybacteria bacterium GW2011_GWC1_48_11]KKW04747.1 MAG: Peptidoglycan glycosyltransferase [Parcubacteria group bacterium GW2011_GWB1_49_12]KKW08952.1 MAG: Peptidoglycan glycosyltransferase [Parcubacteria group bacterium GW2011_GWA1_49_26]KKW14279.1 MAG: Peptidoglycan glycosyltransferase [Parcubacteria group bacterium GW2011_GWA2_50_10]OHA61008.1 MAG: penicillin-binding protein 2 [Candidatus Wilder